MCRCRHNSDNGKEFINEHLLTYCQNNEITFTRGRPYQKNDSCYVEQKNWAVVRQTVGYARYDTCEQLEALSELYRHLRLLTNFFYPQMKLVAKTRDGAKVIRRYDKPTTPYQRLLDAKILSETESRALQHFYHQLNPVQLRQDVNACQQRLQKLTPPRTRTA